MNWLGFLINAASHLPFERLIKPEKVKLDIYSLSQTAPVKVTSPELEAGVMEPPTKEGAKQPKAATETPYKSKLSNEELLVYQNREIARELWLLERHLSQGCRISNKDGDRTPCDCCAKGSFIAGLAYESIPMVERSGLNSDIYLEIAHWSDALEEKVTVPAIESGKYDYRKLSGEASKLRKKLMGTASSKALDEAKDSQ